MQLVAGTITSKIAASLLGPTGVGIHAIVQAVANIVAHLARAPLILVLDNCEHVVDAAADLAQALHEGAPRTLILATSREALRAEGEWIHRLQTLPAPAENAIGAEAASSYPAV